ncbi:hypothetical protein J6590_071169 [Homalodisca vitripennis]|nr:hypothetical protein J6590_071169 [Homalodisca vitripennis]
MKESASTSLTRVELNNIFRDLCRDFVSESSKVLQEELNKKREWTRKVDFAERFIWDLISAHWCSSRQDKMRQSQFLVVGELDWRQIYSSSQCTGSAFSHWTGVSAGAGSVYTRPASSPADWLQSAGLLAGLV